MEERKNKVGSGSLNSYKESIKENDGEKQELRMKILKLEKENKDKDKIISNFKAENGRLRSQMNILKGKLKRKEIEEVKEKRQFQGENKKRIPPAKPHWSGLEKKISGKLSLLY